MIRKLTIIYIILSLLLLSCNNNISNPSNTSNNNKNNSDYMIKERVGKYIGSVLGEKENDIELIIEDTGKLNILLLIKSNIGERKVSCNIDIGNIANEKLLDLVVKGSFNDPTDLAGPRICEVHFKFISIEKVSISFNYRGDFYGSILEKYN